MFTYQHSNLNSCKEMLKGKKKTYKMYVSELYV